VEQGTAGIYTDKSIRDGLFQMGSPRISRLSTESEVSWNVLDGWPAYEVEIVRGDSEHPKGRKIVFIDSEIESAEELEPTSEQHDVEATIRSRPILGWAVFFYGLLSAEDGRRFIVTRDGFRKTPRRRFLRTAAGSEKNSPARTRLEPSGAVLCTFYS
jgi:hypothetical protein